VVGTPHDIFEKIYRRLFIMKKFLYDDCPDNHECNQLDWFDLLLNDFIGYLNYVNPTFSKIAAVLVKVFQQYLIGKSTILLVHTLALNKVFYRRYLKIAVLILAGQIIFKGK
jgi:hypothetical protein